MWHVKGTGVVHVACKGDRSGTSRVLVGKPEGKTTWKTYI